MFKLSLPKAALIIFLSFALSGSALAQYPPPTTTTTTAPPPTTTGASPAPIATSGAMKQGYSRTGLYVGAGIAGTLALTRILGAQQVEIHPNAGFFWPDRMNTNGQLKADGIYGLKVGVVLDPNVELEGNFGYINHFEMREPPNPLEPSFGIRQPTVYALLYDINGTWNFGQRFFNPRVSPYVTLGAGALSAQVRHTGFTFIRGGGFALDADGNFIPNPERSIMLQDGDTFLTLNYGGGIKATNLWGPMGLRADIRGRTLPNFFGEATNWPELTGGLVFTWGER